MIWVVEKKVVYHLLDLGFERIRIPVRVEFEFAVERGTLVPDSLTKTVLYNRPLLEKRYPHLDRSRLDATIENTVDREILIYLQECRYLVEDGG
ncbi:MAG TPA: hypothetical protein VMU60_06430 [Syntrophobacteria bacterium]|nr:hypothetical protein [Syntrophobacteria bacterium]